MKTSQEQHPPSPRESCPFGVVVLTAVPGLVSIDAVLFVLKLLFGLSVLLVLYVIYLRAAQIVYDRRKRGQEEEWEPLLLDYIVGSVSVEEVEHKMQGANYDLLGEILIEYSQDIQGQALDRMIELWKRLGFDKYSTQRLSSRSVWRRAYGATMLGIMRESRAVAMLIKLLRDSSPLVTFAAARALARIGVKEQLGEILDIVARSESWSEDQFAEIILDFGQDIASDLIRLCEDEGIPLERLAFIVDVLGFLRYQPAYDVLARLAEKSEKEIRIRAVKALGEISRPESSLFLVGLLGDQSWEIRSQAAKALGKIGDRGAIPALMVSLDDEIWWVRYNAAVAMSKLGEEAMSTLRSVAKNSESERARRAAQQILEQHVSYAKDRVS